MNNYSFDFYDMDIKRMSYLDIRKWLIERRNKIDRSKYGEREYLEKIKAYTDEWYRHYENNKGFYNSHKFRKALLSMALKPLMVKTIINRKTVHLGEMMSFMKENQHNPFAETLEQTADLELKEAIRIYWDKINECFAFKNKSRFKTLLDELIKERLICTVEYQVKVYKGKSHTTFANYEEFKAEIENLDNYKSQLFDINLSNKNETDYIGYQDLLKEYCITRGAYSGIIDERQFCEKEFKKKNFINLGFMLSLPFNLLNTLLAYYGLSLSGSIRKFDEIVERAFKIGFGRDLAIDLIDYYNFELLDEYGVNEKDGKNNYAEVPTLNSMRGD